MKHLITMALALVAGASLSPAAAQQLDTRIDTLSYSVGMAQTQGLKEYLAGQMGVDLQYMDDFVRGLKEGADANITAPQKAYFAGLQIGQQITNQMLGSMNKDLFGSDSTQTLSTAHFMAGFVSGLTGEAGLMTMEEASATAQRLVIAIKEEATLKQYGANKKAGEDFLKENATKEGIKVLPGGVQYKVLKEGTGAVPTTSDRVKVHYEGRTLDGKVFDSSYKRGNPAVFGCTQVIKGWTEALTNMPVGSEWEVYIPQELAYGDRKQGADIDPFSMLIFKIELIDIEK